MLVRTPLMKLTRIVNLGTCECNRPSCDCEGNCEKESRHTIYKHTGEIYHFCSICTQSALDSGLYDIFPPEKKDILATNKTP